MMSLVLIFIIPYLIGSIPFGYLIVYYKEGVDVRETGSGGIDATNVLRRSGKLACALTLFLDIAKSVFAMVVVELMRKDIDLGICSTPRCTYEQLQSSWFWSESLLYAAGIMAILGHCFPVWLKFRGGKGTVVGLSVFFTIAPIGAMIVTSIILFTALITRYVSLGSIIGFTLLPLFVWKFRFHIMPSSPIPAVVSSIICSAIVIFKHRENIKRLLRGEENKIGKIVVSG